MGVTQTHQTQCASVRVVIVISSLCDNGQPQQQQQQQNRQRRPSAVCVSALLFDQTFPQTNRSRILFSSKCFVCTIAHRVCVCVSWPSARRIFKRSCVWAAWGASRATVLCQMISVFGDAATLCVTLCVCEWVPPVSYK